MCLRATQTRVHVLTLPNLLSILPLHLFNVRLFGSKTELLKCPFQKILVRNNRTYGDFLPRGQAHKKHSIATLFKTGRCSNPYPSGGFIPSGCGEIPFPLGKLYQSSPKDLNRMNMFPCFYHEILPPNFWQKDTIPFQKG